MPNEIENTGGESPSDTIVFHYIKGPGARTLLAHGAVVGGTPRGEVVLTPFVERVPIPTQATHELSEVSERGDVKRGKVGKQIDQVCREGVIREFDVSFVLPPSAAEQIANLLLEKAKEVQGLSEEWETD